MRENSVRVLKNIWRKDLKCEPPATASVEFLKGHIEWNKQASQHGGLSKKANVKIRELTKQLREGKDLKPDHNMAIKTGTKLIRQYKGKKYEVLATASGFIYEEKEYKSLSMIAKEITGTSWNGKVFFGVKRQKR